MICVIHSLPWTIHRGWVCFMNSRQSQQIQRESHMIRRVTNLDLSASSFNLVFSDHTVIFFLSQIKHILSKKYFTTGSLQAMFSGSCRWNADFIKSPELKLTDSEKKWGASFYSPSFFISKLTNLSSTLKKNWFCIIYGSWWSRQVSPR